MTLIRHPPLHPSTQVPQYLDLKCRKKVVRTAWKLIAGRCDSALSSCVRRWMNGLLREKMQGMWLIGSLGIALN
jgi:hypothetical protein